MSNKSIEELLKESDPNIVNKDFELVGDRFIGFTYWVELGYGKQMESPLPARVVQTFLDLRNCPDAYCTEEGLKFTPTPRTLQDVIDHVKIMNGEDDLGDFTRFLHRVDSEYPKSLTVISPDRLLSLFEGEIDDWYESVIWSGESGKEVINCTTRMFIEKILLNHENEFKKKEVLKSKN